MAAFSRIRVDRDQIDLLTEVLVEARNHRIGRKIELRATDPDGEELLAIRWELSELNRMLDEASRAKEDLNGP